LQEFFQFRTKSITQEAKVHSKGYFQGWYFKSASCKARYRFSCKNEVLCDFVSEKASFEFEYNTAKS
jgi:hypothetical protein